ncbi:hypothetical protein Pla108_32920 [Botrimarina colliarenosi]|uniref:Tetratricopeptide repeat protein n=1 Tax=Botrimarina colliarenosi TaxID=2528001 RepID=A0A5C6AD74_9BACT|nr:tetratricopeptide repeat protein [Botrimarina colliarenosi]TWT96203.1 hypothetical protein Pla108_32920 [Botrimarina colliarenosi]
MAVPDPSHFRLRDSVAVEAGEPGRVILWAPGDADGERVRLASVAGAVVESAHGVQSLLVDATPMRLTPPGWLKALRTRLGFDDGAEWRAPTGEAATVAGEKRKGLRFAWSDDADQPLTEGQAVEAWPAARIDRRLGENLFVVSGADTPSSADPDDDTSDPLKQAVATLQNARRQDDAGAELQSLIDHGAALTRSGNAAAGVPQLEKAVTLAAARQDRLRLRDARTNLGAAYLDLRRGDQAVAEFQAVLDDAREAGDRYSEKMMLSQLGTAWSLAMDPAAALRYFEAALRIAESLDDPADQADLWWRAAVCHDELGDRPSATEAGERSIALLRRLGSPVAEVYAQRLPTLTDDAAPVARGPSVLRMAMSAATALTRFAGSGFRRVDAETRAARLALCGACEQHTGVRCRACGCFTAQKTWLPHERCPLGKWPAEKRPAAERR